MDQHTVRNVIARVALIDPIRAAEYAVEVGEQEYYRWLIRWLS